MSPAQRLNIGRNKGEGRLSEGKEAGGLLLTEGGGMVALAATRNLLYIMLGTFP
jgi:hypothetical protein